MHELLCHNIMWCCTCVFKITDEVRQITVSQELIWQNQEKVGEIVDFSVQQLERLAATSGHSGEFSLLQKELADCEVDLVGV
jgi:hypothetical protein